MVEITLERPELSSRELAWHIIDKYSYYISESSVYRILKLNGLITTPSFRIMSASDSFQDKTTSVNQMWQTDFTYFKIVGWGWYYLSTILDDCSPGQSEHKMKPFVQYYNYERYHESINNLTPSEVHYGTGERKLRRRKRIQQQTLIERKNQNIYLNLYQHSLNLYLKKSPFI